MKIKLNWQRRATILFAAIIFIFSLILTIFAIREAERERLIREKEIEDEQQRSAGLVIDQVKAIISGAEDRIIRKVQGSRLVNQEGDFEGLCRKISDEEEIVDEIFLIKEKGSIVFPLRKPLFLLSEEIQESKKGETKIEANPLFKEAEALQFKTRNYPQAIKSYQTLTTIASDSVSRAILLNCIGRCYEKSGNHMKAIESYQKILKEYPDEFSSDGVAIGLIAQYQIGNINWKMGRKIKAVESFLEFYNSLLESRWPLSRSQFYFYLNKIKDMIEKSITDINGTKEGKVIREKWESLKKLEENQLKRMNTIENIMAKFIPIIETRKPLSPSPGSFSHLSEPIGEENYLISYIPVNESSVFGMKIASGILSEKLLPPILAKLPLRKDWHILVENEQGKKIAGEDLTRLKSPLPRLTFSRSFEDDFPPWKVSIYQTERGSAKRQFNLRRNVYILSVLVVIVALFFGGFLAIKSTARELELARLKSDFVSTVSHEFRTPLTSIRYLAEMLQRGRVQGEDKKQQYYETITTESERLSRLIENILDFSKVEAGMKEYKFEEIDVVELARDVASRFQEQVAPQGFVINSEISKQMLRVNADREALSRALFNLLDNAVKYSGESRNVFLRAWSDRENVFFEVRDEGIGISKDEQEKVFEKFYRTQIVHNSNIKGSGIGLTVVSHIVKAHGGEVLLESEVGKGTKVTIRIPVKP
jgi:signal transduction histidine kinase/tetratricopeptide (TPR) repeat protein